MKKQLTFLMVPALAVAISSTASADLLYDNGGPDGVNGYSNILGAGLDRRVADDFILPEGPDFLVDNVEINYVWGTPGAPGTATEFLVQIFADDAGGGPGTLVSSQVSNSFTATETGNVFFSRAEFIFSVDLAPVALAGGTSYYLSIQPNGSDNGFQLTSHVPVENGGDTYVNYVDLTGGLWQSAEKQFDTTSDMVFRVNGEAAGNPCPWDFDGDNVVGLSDLLKLLELWGDPYGLADLLDLLAAWGDCPGGKLTGACCLPRDDMGCGVVQPDPGCIITTAGECRAAGGTYLGDDVPCEQTTPALTHNSPQLNHEVVTAAHCGGAGPKCTDGPYKIDPWTTVEGAGGTNVMNFGGNPIPADFFGPGSDPFEGQFPLKGQPLAEVTVPGFPDPLTFGEADTLVARQADPFDRCDLPPNFPSDPVTVDIEIVALSLVSCDPITITFNGGQNPEQWDVKIDLSNQVGQPSSFLTAVKTHCNGGTYTSQLDVCPVFTFIKVSDPGLMFELDFCENGIPPLQFILAQDSPWVHDLSQSIGQSGGVCTAFYPGIKENDPDTDCDCNGNGVRDKCDIANGTSDDNNNDGIPDECQP